MFSPCLSRGPSGSACFAAMKQRTLSREVSLKGKALHTGDNVHLTMKPAPAGTASFSAAPTCTAARRSSPDIHLVTDLVRATTITVGSRQHPHGGTCAQRAARLRDRQRHHRDGRLRTADHGRLGAAVRELIQQGGRRRAGRRSASISCSMRRFRFPAATPPRRAAVRRAEDLLHVGGQPRHSHAASFADD